MAKLNHFELGEFFRKIYLVYFLDGSDFIYGPVLFYFRQMALKLALSTLLPMQHMQATKADSRRGEAAVESVVTG